tara:strand:- start:225 stop:542 length:318 start_codon:yes stop_codon:yes gene_type:complete
MDNQFISSVRNKINQKKKRRKVTSYAIKLLPIIILMFIYIPDKEDKYIENPSFISGMEVLNDQSYDLSEEDILLYLIDELDVDELLSISFENNLLDNTILNGEEI